MALLHRHLVCFYCGRRSAKKQDGKVRKWECENCEAVNYLDENGEITDPPVEVQSSNNVRYASSVPRASSPDLEPPDNSLFCAQCLLNQQILTQTLASYLPPPTDPEYPRYEQSYPAYRKRLEEQYPQVCEDCEPKVRERLRFTGYAAKTDHLRRMMEASRDAARRRRTPGPWNWQSIAVFLGWLLWTGSLVQELLWHGLSALSNGEEIWCENGDCTLSASQCIRELLSHQQLPPKCIQKTASFSDYSLYAGLLSIWWHPCLQPKIDGRPGRIVGSGEYYKLQLIGMGIRYISTSALQGGVGEALTLAAVKGAHILSIILVLLITLVSKRTIRIDNSPKVTFPKIMPEPTFQVGPGSSKAAPNILNHSSVYPQPFPVEKLAPQRQISQSQSFQIPTPPYETDNDAMDWTPSQQPANLLSASLRPRNQPPPPLVPSPFHGRLPPAPIAPAHKLRNPPNQPTFQPTHPQTQQNFFQSVTNRPKFDANGTRNNKVRHDYQEAPQKLFLPTLDGGTTGLESLLENTFTLADEPVEIRSMKQQRQRQRQQQGAQLNFNSNPPLTASSELFDIPITHLISSLLLAVFLGLWYYKQDLPILGRVALTLTSLLSFSNLVHSIIGIPKERWCCSDMLLFLTEGALTMFLSWKANPNTPLSADTLPEMKGLDFTQLGMGLVMAVVAQEGYVSWKLSQSQQPLPQKHLNETQHPQQNIPPKPQTKAQPSPTKPFHRSPIKSTATTPATAAPSSTYSFSPASSYAPSSYATSPQATPASRRGRSRGLSSLSLGGDSTDEDSSLESPTAIRSEYRNSGGSSAWGTESRSSEWAGKWGGNEVGLGKLRL
ncbi:MAG: hypothetical protein M1834_003336 [Cirrosporium novae-zelandiae]|nr:MAG: hypothetical protein M1834_003336 [Cirrosporium novae-zelandiae]